MDVIVDVLDLSRVSGALMANVRAARRGVWSSRRDEARPSTPSPRAPHGCGWATSSRCS